MFRVTWEIWRKERSQIPGYCPLTLYNRLSIIPLQNMTEIPLGKRKRERKEN